MASFTMIPDTTIMVVRRVVCTTRRNFESQRLVSLRSADHVQSVWNDFPVVVMVP